MIEKFKVLIMNVNKSTLLETKSCNNPSCWMIAVLSSFFTVMVSVVSRQKMMLWNRPNMGWCTEGWVERCAHADGHWFYGIIQKIARKLVKKRSTPYTTQPSLRTLLSVACICLIALVQTPTNPSSYITATFVISTMSDNEAEENTNTQLKEGMISDHQLNIYAWL